MIKDSHSRKLEPLFVNPESCLLILNISKSKRKPQYPLQNLISVSLKAYTALLKLRNHNDFNQNPCYRVSVCEFSRKREIRALTKTWSRYWSASKRSSFCLPRKPLRYHCFHWFKSLITHKHQKFVNWDWNPRHYTIFLIKQLLQ